MSMSFTKVFSSITESTVWQESHTTRIVWITMLTMTDRKGYVWASIPGLADRAKVTVAETEEAITRFLSPDLYSRTKDHEGRRIEEVDGGWLLLNYIKYREMRDADERREYKAGKEQERRDRAHKQSRTNVDTVDKRGHNAEADGDGDGNGEKRQVLPGVFLVKKFSREETLVASRVAAAILNELQLSGKELKDNLRSLCRMILSDGTTKPEALKDRLVASWLAYSKASRFDHFAVRPTKFFGEGKWREYGVERFA